MLVTALTVGLVGVSYGATAVSAGFPIWFPVALATSVVAASSEFVLVGILAAGGGAVAAAMAGLLLNLRHLPYGMTVHDAVGIGWRRVASSHLLNHETVAFTLAETTPAARRAALNVSGLAILVCWPGGALLGAAAGTLLASPAALGLDAVFPAVIATLVLPRLAAGRSRRASWCCHRLWAPDGVAGRAADPASTARTAYPHLPPTRTAAPVMTSLTTAVAAGAALAAGTLAIRLAGPAIASRLRVTERGNELLDAAATVILFAVMASSALTTGHHFSDVPRPAGVLTAIVLARRRTPFVVVVIAAAATTAVIRYAGY